MVVAAMGFAAVHGNAEAFHEAVEVATPFPGARHVCRTMRALVDIDAVPARIQDPFGLRTFPQVHGALMDRLGFAEQVVTQMANAPSENPIVSAQLGVAHHGAFHAAYLVQSLDALVLALAQSAQLSLARLTMLAEPSYTGMNPFLGDGTPAASGVMIVEYSAASALAELRALATPAGTQVVTLSRGVEEDASFATLAAQQALGAVSRFRAVLAAELVAALRCLRMQGARPEPLEPALAWLDERDGGVPDMHDRDLTHELVMAEELVTGLPDHVGAVASRAPSSAGSRGRPRAPSPARAFTRSVIARRSSVVSTSASSSIAARARSWPDNQAALTRGATFSALSRCRSSSSSTRSLPIWPSVVADLGELDRALRQRSPSCPQCPSRGAGPLGA